MASGINIIIKALRGSSMPGGFLLGRASPGSGAIELLRPSDLQKLGINTNGGATVKHGFGFFIGGLMKDNELLGGVVLPEAISFSTGEFATVKSMIPATALAVFKIVVTTAGVPTQVGTITFVAGAMIGAVAWSPNPFVNAVGDFLQLYAPSPKDATLSFVSGTVAGGPG